MSYDPSKWTSYSASRDDDWRQDENRDDWYTPGSSYAERPANSSYLSTNELSEETLRGIHIDDNLLALVRDQSRTASSNDNSNTSQEDDQYRQSSDARDYCIPEGINVDEEKPEDCMDIEIKKTQLLELTDRLSIVIKGLQSSQQMKLTVPIIAQLSVSLLDGTVFEIVKGLEDIQQLKERNLYNKRMKVVGDHKIERTNLNQKYQTSLLECGSKTHQKAVVTKRHDADKEKLERKLRHELQKLDQKIVLELDQQVSDQQATLQRAGVPLFSVTNNPDEIQLQMTLLQIISQVVNQSN